jgi:hypothetical protein
MAGIVIPAESAGAGVGTSGTGGCGYARSNAGSGAGAGLVWIDQMTQKTATDNARDKVREYVMEVAPEMLEETTTELLPRLDAMLKDFVITLNGFKTLYKVSGTCFLERSTLFQGQTIQSHILFKYVTSSISHLRIRIETLRKTMPAGYEEMPPFVRHFTLVQDEE